MSPFLLRGDRASFWIALVFGALLLCGGTGIESRQLLVGVALWAFWATTSLFTRARVSHFEATLPIDGRDLFRKRLEISLTSLWALAAIAMALSVFRLGRIWPGGLFLIVQMAAVSTVSLLACHLYRPHELRPGSGASLIWPVLTVLSLQIPEPLAVALCAIAIAILLPRTLAAMPRAYQLPIAGTGWFGFNWRMPALIPSFTWKPVWRAIVGWDLLIYAGYFTGWIEDAIFVSPILLGGLVGRVQSASPWLFTLPAGRWRFFAIATAGLVAASSLLFVLSPLNGGPLVEVNPGERWGVRARRETGTPNVRVPLAYWERAAGEVPVLTAPWGEAVRPHTARFLWVRLYNPYTVRPESSQRLFDLQFQRATAAVYGKTIRHDKHWPAAEPPLHGRRQQQIFDLAMIWLAALVYFTGFSYLRNRLPRWLQTFLYNATPLAVFLSMWLFSDLQMGESFSSVMLAPIHARLPADTGIVSAGCILALAAMWWWAKCRFDGFEARFDQAPAKTAD